MMVRIAEVQALSKKKTKKPRKKKKPEE